MGSLIGAILDQQIKAEHAWAFPRWIYERFGDLNPDIILKIQSKKLLREYMKDKWPKRLSQKEREKWLNRVNSWLRSALKMFKEMNTDPVNMFENRVYTVQELYFILRQIPGFGPKKTKMIIRDFVYGDLGKMGASSLWYEQIKKVKPNFGIDKNLFALDMPVDIHVKRVFKRFVFGEDYVKRRDEPAIVEDILVFSRMAFPDLPAEIDGIFWYVGRTWCGDNPKCEECPLRKGCGYVERGR